MQACMWRLTHQHAVFYTDDRATLNAVLAYPRFPHRDVSTATTYAGRNGRIFAWQFTIPYALWTALTRLLGKGTVTVLDPETRNLEWPELELTPAPPAPVATAPSSASSRNAATARTAPKPETAKLPPAKSNAMPTAKAAEPKKEGRVPQGMTAREAVPPGKPSRPAATKPARTEPVAPSQKAAVAPASPSAVAARPLRRQAASASEALLPSKATAPTSVAADKRMQDLRPASAPATDSMPATRRRTSNAAKDAPPSTVPSPPLPSSQSPSTEKRQAAKPERKAAGKERTVKESPETVAALDAPANTESPSLLLNGEATAPALKGRPSQSPGQRPGTSDAPMGQARMGRPKATATPADPAFADLLAATPLDPALSARTPRTRRKAAPNPSPVPLPDEVVTQGRPLARNVPQSTPPKVGVSPARLKGVGQNSGDAREPAAPPRPRSRRKEPMPT